MAMNLRGSQTIDIAVDEISQVGQARRTAQQLAEESNLNETDAGRCTLVATELATNLVKHAKGGHLCMRLVPGVTGVEMIAVDRGPGFNLSEGLADGFSSGGTPGNGLGAVSRLASVFDAYTDARGSVVFARVHPKAERARDMPLGVYQRALHGALECGDSWHVAIDGPRVSVLMIDGLGHGAEAEHAALAGVGSFEMAPFEPAETLLNSMHGAMNGTRGGAVAIAQFDGERDSLSFAGIGNIAGRLIKADTSRGMASLPGIVGVQFRKAQRFTYTQASGALLIMHSDGLQTRWNLGDYPGLGSRHPAIIASILQRDYCRERDDATVLVMELGGVYE